jgi:4-aminobutyrate aminotransferase-like enzyme
LPAPRPAATPFVAFSGGFHGRTFMGMAMTGKVFPYKAGFGAMPGDVYHAPFPARTCTASPSKTIRSRRWRRLFKADVDPARVAAIVIEPVQGEGGFYVAPKGFMQEAARDLRQDRHPADRRRGADRFRAHRHHARHRAITASSRTW